MILALETSCDETAAACVRRDGQVLASVVASQADLHARYGGVVPEVASRRHLELTTPVVAEALERAEATLDEVELVAVTRGPGLIGALLVGISAAKALAWARRLPLAAVDHLHGHVASLFLRGRAGRISRSSPPSSACSRAAGTRCCSTFPTMTNGACSDRPWTTRRARPSTRARACWGSATRAGRRSTGWPGKAIRRRSRSRSRVCPGLDFSFSGVKTALLYAVRDLEPAEVERRRADLAASYQRAIVRALVERTLEAAERFGARRLAVVGGVAANSELRARLEGSGAVLAPLELCTDNAAMIGSAARYVRSVPFPDYLELDAYASAN